MAAQANRKIMRKQRNAAVPTFSSGSSRISTPTILSTNERVDIPNVIEYSEDAERAQQLAEHDKLTLSRAKIVVENCRHLCQCCRVGFSSFEAVVGHLTDKEMETAKRPVCLKTMEAGYARNNLKAHIGRHVKKGQICGINDCKAILTSGFAIKSHRANVHPEVVRPRQSFPCSEVGCSVICSSKDALNMHIKGHKNPDVACTHCGLLVPFKNLKRHKSKECKLTTKNLAVCLYDGCGAEVSMHGSARHILEAHQNLSDTVDL